MGWQPVAGWDERYEVSAEGQVRERSGRLLGQWTNSHGYLLVRLSGPRKVERVHRLVARAFVANLSGRPFVNHLNNDRSDNRSANLEWCTQRENLAHADRQGRMQRDYWVGKRSPNANLTDAEAAEVLREYAAGEVPFSSLARRYGVSKRTIGRIVHGESYAEVE